MANAGLPQTVAVGTTVTLDGSASNDVDGDALTFRWAFTTAPAGSARDPVGSHRRAARPLSSTSRARIRSSSSSMTATLTSPPATVTITTLNSRPVANAGATADGRGGRHGDPGWQCIEDVDGDPLTFRWALTTVPTGSAATLAAPTAMHPTFGVDKPGTYVAQLIVNDGTVDSAPVTVIITANIASPAAPERRPDHAEWDHQWARDRDRNPRSWYRRHDRHGDQHPDGAESHGHGAGERQLHPADRGASGRYVILRGHGRDGPEQSRHDGDGGQRLAA